MAMSAPETLVVPAGRLRRHLAVLAERLLTVLLLIFFTIILLTPLVWMVSTALKEQAQIFTYPPEWIPDPALWSNFRESTSAYPFGRYATNTLIIAGLNIAGVLITASMAAYAFARLRFPGRDLIFMILLSTLMLPFTVLMIPRYIQFRELGWLDSWKPLIVPNWFGGSVFFIFLLRQFFRTIPRDLSDAAKLDGASEFRIYWQIVLPLSKPALAVVAVFVFLDTWNDFLAPLIYITSPDKYTVSLGLSQFLGNYTTQYAYLMAASTMMIIPTIAVFFLAQRYFVHGVVLTGVKG
jgi:ABC-type glycerol-3-phosphate transport system permease component